MIREKNYAGICEGIEDLKKKIGEIMPSVNESVESIINNNITSSITIERILDQLLDYATLGIGEQEFMRLNKYYAKINKKNSSFYEREFKALGENE